MKIPKQLIADYACVCIVYMILIVVMHPVYFGEFQVTPELVVLLAQEAVLAFCVAISAELVVTYVLKRPFSYADEMAVRFHHFLLCTIVVIPLSMALLNQLFVLRKFGWEHWEFAWTNFEGSFSLQWFLNGLLPCIIGGVIMILIAMPIISQIRVMLLSLRELKEINQMLESEQIRGASHQAKDAADMITLKGESRESFTVNPLDIMYVESVGNYLFIAYFNGSELCQKRLRSSLKEVEEKLEAFPFMVHIHRAFLVNINFITQVSGNSAGYKINLFGTDRILPVSKTNVNLFRERIKDLCKGGLV